MDTEQLRDAIREEFSKYEVGLTKAGVNASNVDYDVLEAERIAAWDRMEKLFANQLPHEEKE